MSYVPLTPRERDEMCRAVGVDSVEDLWREIPADLRLSRPLELPPSMAEIDLRKHLTKLADENLHPGRATCFLGGGMAEHFVPAVLEELLHRSEFYTAYTPYQPEVSQGTLQSIYEYQTMIARLTGMDVSNASVHDGASALAEGVLMAVGATRRRRVLVSGTIAPHYREVLQTYAGGGNMELVEVPPQGGMSDYDGLSRELSREVAAVVVPRPNYFGLVEEPGDLGERCQEAGALLVMVVEPLSLALLAPPSELGAHIAVGDGQPLGNGLSWGGPTFGFLACKKDLVRRLPGRLVGRTVDSEGKTAYVLTLQTREQHIRRERATSNICTNSALGALAGAIYLASLGPDGLSEVAYQCLKKSHYAATRLAELPGVTLAFEGPFFKEFVLRVEDRARDLLRSLADAGQLVGPYLGDRYPELGEAFIVCVTEERTPAEIETLAESVGRITARR